MLVSTTFTLFIWVAPVLTFCLLEYLFNLKTKLIKQFKSVRRYRFFLFIITFVPYLIHAWFVFFRDVTLSPLAISMVFLNIYLTHIPQGYTNP